MNDEETVTITRKQYESLVDSENQLLALEAYGVDNWQGYSDAMNDIEGIFSEEEA